MERYFFISCCGVVLLYFAGITSTEVHTATVDFLAANEKLLFGGGLLGALVLAGASLLFNRIGFFNILYVMAKAALELVKLLLCALSLGALFFWFDLRTNFWLEDGRVLAIVLYAWLFGAAFCLRMFDFNYPVRETLLSYSALPLVFLTMVWVSRLIW
jgi:uncharacterized membrane protein YdcZ (DUF606 family)